MIDLSLENLWRCWKLFRNGKQPTAELHEFQYNLEQNLFELHKNLKEGTYEHGRYRTFEVHDNKRRTISVACVRDRLVHRVVYEYLSAIYDKTFIYDAWSCRKGKGIHGALDRLSSFLKRWPDAYVWRGDIKKFFDNVDHDTLIKIISRRVIDPQAMRLLKEVIGSYRVNYERERERVNQFAESQLAISPVRFSQIFI